MHSQAVITCWDNRYCVGVAGGSNLMCLGKSATCKSNSCRVASNALSSSHSFCPPFPPLPFLLIPFPPFPGEEDATYINWMMVKKGAPQRCECGHWFELIEAKPTKI